MIYVERIRLTSTGGLRRARGWKVLSGCSKMHEWITRGIKRNWRSETEGQRITLPYIPLLYFPTIEESRNRLLLLESTSDRVSQLDRNLVPANERSSSRVTMLGEDKDLSIGSRKFSFLDLASAGRAATPPWSLPSALYPGWIVADSSRCQPDSFPLSPSSCSPPVHPRHPFSHR